MRPEPAVADPIAARIRQRSASADPCERQGVVHRAAMAPCELSSDLLACAGARDAPAVLTLRVEHWCQAGPEVGGYCCRSEFQNACRKTGVEESPVHRHRMSVNPQMATDSTDERERLDSGEKTRTA
jgi:hypothetical protein